MKTLLSVHSLLWLLMIGAFCCVTPKVNAGETYTHYSEWLTASEMQRVPHPYNLDFSSKPRWSYVMGIELESFLDTWHTYDNDKIMDYLKEYPEIYFRRKKSEYQQEHLTDTSSQRQQMATRCPIPLIALACRAYRMKAHGISHCSMSLFSMADSTRKRKVSLILPKSLTWFAHNSFLHHHTGVFSWGLCKKY